MAGLRLPMATLVILLVPVLPARAGVNKATCQAMRASYDLCVKNYGTQSSVPAHHCKTWLAQMKAGGCL